MRRQTFSSLCLLTLGGLLGCGTAPPEPSAPAQAPSPGDPTCANSPLEWLTRKTLAEDAEVVLEDVTYCSEGLRIRGQICRPQGAEKKPILSLNHSGVLGVLDRGTLAGACAQLARRGFAVFESDFRGESTSEGQVEICLGEVADALNMLSVANREPYVQPDRVVMMGMSHGGCVVLHALEFGFRPLAAAVLYPPTDFGDAYRFWQGQLANGTPFPDPAKLSALLRKVTGGAPGDSMAVDTEYARRSPMAEVALMPLVPTPLFIAQGTADIAVPFWDTCQFAAASGPAVTAFRTTPDGQYVAESPPALCPQTSLHWLPAGLNPRDWTNTRYLGIYEGATHGGGPAGPWMLFDGVGFLQKWTR